MKKETVNSEPLQILNFSYHYDKLFEEDYTTIRGRTKINKYKVGELLDVQVKKRHHHYVEVISKGNIRLKDIPLPILKQDAAHGDNAWPVNCLDDFIQGLQKFWIYLKVTPDTVVTMFALRKVEING